MDDATILREIARRIRDGIDRTTDSGALPPAESDAAREQDHIARLAHELSRH